MPERTVPETLELVRYGRNDFTRDGVKGVSRPADDRKVWDE